MTNPDFDDSSFLQKKMQQDIKQISRFLSLIICRIFLNGSLFFLTAAVTFAQNHLPVPFYMLLCYNFIYFILKTYFASYKEPEFTLTAFKKHYHYQHSSLLAGQASLIVAFALLFIMQTTFLFKMRLSASFFLYTPLYLALALLCLRYTLSFFLRFYLRKRLLYGRY